MLKQKIGLDANSIGSRTIARAVERRSVACGLSDRAAYWERVQTSPQELVALIESVVVPETWFFRDKEPFVYLSHYVTTERSKATAPILRVLSVPCSTGEEPYSIAMTLFDAGLTAKQFSIDAMDISQQALLKAKQAIYSRRAFRGGDGLNTKQRYFQEVTNGFEVRSFVRDTVTFKQANVLDPGLLAQGKYHVIFCRNLLIYLDPDARDRLLQSLDRALAPAGLLIVGAAETMQIPTQHYTAVPHRSAFAYRKASHSDVMPVNPVAPSASPNYNNVVAATAPTTLNSKPQIAASDLERAKDYANRGQLIEAAQHCEAYVRQHRTDANAYLLLGEIYQGLDRLDPAEQAYQKAIYLNPQGFEALVHLSLLKEQKGDFSASYLLRQRLQRLITTQSNSFQRDSGDGK